MPSNTAPYLPLWLATVTDGHALGPRAIAAKALVGNPLHNPLERYQLPTGNLCATLKVGPHTEEELRQQAEHAKPMRVRGEMRGNRAAKQKNRQRQFRQHRQSKCDASHGYTIRCALGHNKKRDAPFRDEPACRQDYREFNLHARRRAEFRSRDEHSDCAEKKAEREYHSEI